MTIETLTRSGSIRSKSFDEKAGTVELVFTTGAKVRRYSRSEGAYDEELVVTPQSVRLGRLNAGAPLLNTHDDWRLESVIGSVVPGSARIEKGKGVAKVLLSKRKEVEGIVTDIRDGVIKNISVGYRYHKVEKTDGQDGDPALWRVVDWEPLEISAVPIPADPGSQFRSQSSPELKFDFEIVAAGGVGSTSALRTRMRMRSASIPTPSPPTPRKIIAMTNRNAARAEAITTALLNRVDPESFALTERARDFRGLSLGEIAAELLSAEGVSTRGMSRSEIVDFALAGGTRAGLHSTSDFTTILADVGTKTLRKAYEAAPQTFRPFTRETTIADFKPVSRGQLGEAPGLERVNEHGEFKRGTIGEGKESFALLTYGKVIGITRQAIVNDDLGAFARIARGFGIQAANLESDLVWAQIIGNPTMGDGVALFHASHGNLGAAAGITADSLALGFEAMRLQKGLDGKTFLNLTPRYLITSVAAVMKGQQVLTSATPAMVATATTAVVPEYIRQLTPISEPRLDGGFTNPATGAVIAGSRFNWFLAADPTQVDTVEIAYLEGEKGPQTSLRRGFDIDGVETKVRLDVGAKTIDWRSFYKNPASAL